MMDVFFELKRKVSLARDLTFILEQHGENRTTAVIYIGWEPDVVVSEQDHNTVLYSNSHVEISHMRDKLDCHQYHQVWDYHWTQEPLQVIVGVKKRVRDRMMRALQRRSP